MKCYEGIQTASRPRVTVHDGRRSYPLTHWGIHGTGFEWGYGGSGPADLAYALLRDCFQDQEIAEEWYQTFKWDVVAQWPVDERWSITEDDIREWVKAHCH